MRAGAADFILKGGIETRDLLRPILDKATGLNDEGFVTHLGAGLVLTEINPVFTVDEVIAATDAVLTIAEPLVSML